MKKKYNSLIIKKKIIYVNAYRNVITHAVHVPIILNVIHALLQEQIPNNYVSAFLTIMKNRKKIVSIAK